MAINPNKWPWSKDSRESRVVIAKVLLEVTPFEADGGEAIGRDPRLVSPDEYRALPREWLVGLKAVRAKCLDCAHTSVEVRKCTVVQCPLWHLRMGSNPFNPPRFAADEADFTDEAVFRGQDGPESLPDAERPYMAVRDGAA